MKISIKTISELTGFSQATVSNALNNKRGVNKETAEKIIEVAKKHGYLSGSKIDNIKIVIYKKSGIIVSDTPFFTALIDGMETESRNAGFQTTLCNLDQRHPDFEQTRSQLLSDPTCAIVLLATEMDEADIIPFLNCRAPLVVLDNWFDESTFDAVLISNTDCVCAAVKYLIRNGHREIGYLRGSIRIKNFYYREKGYERALCDAGLALNPSYAFSLTPTIEGAYDDMLTLLKGKPQLPTAFVADNDIIALGAMRALQECGYAIPQDVSVIGFDDLPFGAISYPALTTIRVHKHEMGRIAVRRLIEVIQNNSLINTKVLVCNTFIERSSVRDLNKDKDMEGELGGNSTD